MFIGKGMSNVDLPEVVDITQKFPGTGGLGILVETISEDFIFAVCTT